MSRRRTDRLAATGVLALAGYAVSRVVLDGRRRARAPKPRVLTWHEALAVVGQQGGHLRPGRGW